MHVFPCERTHEQKHGSFFRSKISKYNTSRFLTTSAGNSIQFPGTPTAKRCVEKNTPPLRRKIRRGWGGRKRNNVKFSILASNANGLKGKIESLKNSINFFKPSCIIIQESKPKNSGMLKLNGYQIFEMNRDGCRGGLFTAIDENLSPVLIRVAQLVAWLCRTDVCQKSREISCFRQFV